MQQDDQRAYDQKRCNVRQAPREEKMDHIGGPSSPENPLFAM